MPGTQELRPLNPDSSEDRFVGINPDSLQTLAEEHMLRGNDIEVLQIARVLHDQLLGLDEDSPSYDAVFHIYAYVNALVDTALAEIQYNVDASDIEEPEA